MSTDRWSEVRRISGEALELARDERAAFVATECATDPAVRKAVERWLRSCDQAESFLPAPAAEFAAQLILSAGVEAPVMEGTRVGPYRIVGEAGHGGMGTVYLAERADDQ